jgi:hypothetical protein
MHPAWGQDSGAHLHNPVAFFFCHANGGIDLQFCKALARYVDVVFQLGVCNQQFDTAAAILVCLAQSRRCVKYSFAWLPSNSTCPESQQEDWV